MRPAVGLGELAQEDGSRDRAALAPTDIAQVSKIALERLAILFVQGHAPCGVQGLLTSAQQGLGQLVIGREQAAVLVSQGDHTRTRQGGDVNHRSGFEVFLNVGQGIAQYQAAFGIGI